MQERKPDSLIDFSDHCLRTFLPVLLQDHTTGKNIIWATDPPPELGVGFADEITLEQLDRFSLSLVCRNGLQTRRSAPARKQRYLRRLGFARR